MLSASFVIIIFRTLLVDTSIVTRRFPTSFSTMSVPRTKDSLRANRSSLLVDYSRPTNSSRKTCSSIIPRRGLRRSHPNDSAKRRNKMERVLNVMEAAISNLDMQASSSSISTTGTPVTFCLKKPPSQRAEMMGFMKRHFSDIDLHMDPSNSSSREEEDDLNISSKSHPDTSTRREYLRRTLQGRSNSLRNLDTSPLTMDPAKPSAHFLGRTPSSSRLLVPEKDSDALQSREWSELAAFDNFLRKHDTVKPTSLLRGRSLDVSSCFPSNNPAQFTMQQIVTECVKNCHPLRLRKSRSSRAAVEGPMPIQPPSFTRSQSLDVPTTLTLMKSEKSRLSPSAACRTIKGLKHPQRKLKSRDLLADSEHEPTTSTTTRTVSELAAMEALAGKTPLAMQPPSFQRSQSLDVPTTLTSMKGGRRRQSLSTYGSHRTTSIRGLKQHQQKPKTRDLLAVSEHGGSSQDNARTFSELQALKALVGSNSLTMAPPSFRRIQSHDVTSSYSKKIARVPPSSGRGIPTAIRSTSAFPQHIPNHHELMDDNPRKPMSARSVSSLLAGEAGGRRGQMLRQGSFVAGSRMRTLRA